MVVIILLVKLFFEVFYPLKYLLLLKPQETVDLETGDLTELRPLVDRGWPGPDERADIVDCKKLHLSVK